MTNNSKLFSCASMLGLALGWAYPAMAEYPANMNLSVEEQAAVFKAAGFKLIGKDSDLKVIADKYGFNVGLDGNEEYVYLAPNRVNLQMAQERYPEIEFLATREIA
jgi:peptide subunit release factor RF-3